MIAVEQFPFTVGRDDDCNLALQSKWISRHHAEIQSSGGDCSGFAILGALTAPL